MSNERVIATLQNALDDLYQQRRELDEAIASLEALTAGKSSGGRKAKAVRKTRSASSGDKRSTEGWTPEKRKAAAERMRKYWAARNKKKASKKAGKTATKKSAARKTARKSVRKTKKS